MDILTILENVDGKMCTSFLISLFLVIGVFFIQKYIYILDRKLAEYSKRKIREDNKPWPLYTGMILGILSFLYLMFSKKEKPSFIDFTNIWHVLFLLTIVAFVIAVFYESISNLGIKIGIIRSFIYVALMFLCYYAGFIAGFFLLMIIAIVILIYFFRYFKKLFI